MPDWKEQVRHRVSSLGLSPTREASVIDEIAVHLGDRYRELLEGGTEEAEALRATLAALDREDEFVRRMNALQRTWRPAPDLRSGSAFSLAGILLDVRYSVRGLRKSWGVTLAAVLTLAAGIGANAAVFSAVRTILIHPLPYRDSSRLANIWLSRSGRPNWHFHVPPADFEVMRASNQIFDQMAMYDSEPRILTGGSADAEEVTAASVSVDLPSMLGVQPAVGRSFDSSDERPGAAVVLLSDSLWHRRFASSPGVVGADLRLDDQPHRVIGVMPPGFVFPDHADLWMPRDHSDQQSNAYVLGKLRSDITLEQAQSGMSGVVAAITGGRPTPGMAFTVEPLKETTTKNARASWLLLLGAVACVFAIGCVNISNLMIARGVRRQREIGLRLALGASHWQVIRLLVAECVVIAVAGGAVAIGVAFWIIGALRAWAPADTPRLAELHVDASLLWITPALSLTTAVVLGLLQAIQLSRRSASQSFRATGTATSATRTQSRARRVLVVTEVALALVLAVGATLLVRSLIRLNQVDPGFRTDHLLTVNLHLPPAKYVQPSQRLEFLRRVQAHVRAMPGALSVAVSSGSMMTGLGLPGAQRTLAQRISRSDGPAPTSPEEANLRRVDADFFRTLDIKVLEGRGFSDADRAGTPRVAVVNRTMGRAYWGTPSVLGKHVSFERMGGKPIWLEIVGIVADTRDIALTSAPQPAFFVPLIQDANGLEADSASLYIRTPRDPLTLANAVRRAIRDVDVNQPIAEVSTMDMAIDRFVEAPLFRTGLLVGLAALSIFLAVIGIYGVVSHGVTERIPEMAVRLALGAEPRQIVGLVLRQGLSLAASGILVGIAASLGGARWLKSVLFDVSPIDPITLIVAPFLILGVVAAACYLPARQAAATEAVRAMRGDADQ